jgi:hypothetical protein
VTLPNASVHPAGRRKRKAPKCKKHCPCSRHLDRENKELRLQLQELRQKYYGRKKKKDRETLEFAAATKKKGARPGHPGWYRKKPLHIDETQIITPKQCGACGSADLEATTIPDEEHIQEDIVLPKREVKKFVRKVMRCRACHTLVRGGRGEDEMPKSYIGPRAKAWANHLRYEIGIPQSKIRMIFRTLFDMPFVQASVAGFENQLTRRSEGLYGQIKNAVIQAPSRYADETGWKENGKNRQLWCFCTVKAAFFHIDESRGSKVVKMILGSSFAGVMVTDFYSAYNLIEGEQQKCIPHFLRILKRKELLFGGENKKADAFLEEMKLLSLRVMDLFKNRKNIRDYGVCRADIICLIRRRLDRPLEHKPLDKWRKQMGKHAKGLTTCLFYPESDSNNNFVERMLRSSVIMRKITFGNRSPKGIKNHQVIMSMLQTMKLNHKLPADVFYRLLLEPDKISLDSIFMDTSHKIRPRDPPSAN